MHSMAAMFGGVGRDGAVVCLSEDGAGVCGGCWDWTEDVGVRWLLSECLLVLGRVVD